MMKKQPDPAAMTPDQLAQFLGAIADLNATLKQSNQVATTNAAARHYGATTTPITGTSQLLSTSPGRLAGWSIRETSGTASAVVRLRDGVDASGGLLATISLAAAESARDWFMPTGIGFANGLYIEIVTGAVEGVCWFGRQR